MGKIKESSTQNLNKPELALLCPVTYIMDRIGGHWKPIILYHLMDGAIRYSELKRRIPAITEKMLIQHLKELQADDLVIRTAQPVVPPVVTYSLTAAGRALKPVMHAMADWAVRDRKQRVKQAASPGAHRSLSAASIS